MSRARTTPRLAVIGAGDRGRRYASLAADAGAAIIAVAEPDDRRRVRFSEEFDVPSSRQYSSWDKVALVSGDVDGVIIATMDDLHVAPALRFAQLGVPLLLEKPIAPSWKECVRLQTALPDEAPPIIVGHVLRHASYTRVLNELLTDGAIGDIVNIHHLEPVGFWHFAHSFARGNWRSAREAAPLIVSKACHDVDWVLHLIPSECVAVSSFGTLTHFRPEHRPAGAADRCIDCHVDCVYDAKSIYLEPAAAGDFSHPVSVIVAEETLAAVYEALTNSRYGQCVYTCDNDVVDTQIASMLFENGQTASITVSAFTEMRGRFTVISGTRGEATVTDAGVDIYSFENRRRRFHTAISPGSGIDSGHAGGDGTIIEFFLGETADPTEAGMRAFPDALSSHRVAFAIEEARLRGEVVDPRDLPNSFAGSNQPRSHQ